jgi:hypothetical protein
LDNRLRIVDHAKRQGTVLVKGIASARGPIDAYYNDKARSFSSGSLGMGLVNASLYESEINGFPGK